MPLMSFQCNQVQNHRRMPEESLVIPRCFGIRGDFKCGASAPLFLRVAACVPLAMLLATEYADAQTGSMDPQRVYARALTSDPNVALARQRLLEMQARYGEAQANRRPQLSANANASVSHGNLPAGQGSESFSTLQGGLALTFPNFARASATASGARAQLRAAE